MLPILIFLEAFKCFHILFYNEYAKTTFIAQETSIKVFHAILNFITHFKSHYYNISNS